MALYHARIMHQRLFPVRYRFVYRVFTLLLDIDQLAEQAQRMRLFSHNRFNLISFYDRDHGPHRDTPLRPWIEQILQQQGIALSGGPIKLLCFPRILGYVFNPISLWYCYHNDGTLRAILCEVSNTFGEHHSYLLSDPDGSAMDLQQIYQAKKCFHVSPFISMDADYHFRMYLPDERARIVIHEYQNEELMLIATLQGQRESLSDRSLLNAAVLRYPLMTLKVILMIHWQAIRIWWRGAPLYRKPSPPEKEIS